MLSPLTLLTDVTYTEKKNRILKIRDWFLQTKKKILIAMPLSLVVAKKKKFRFNISFLWRAWQNRNPLCFYVCFVSENMCSNIFNLRKEEKHNLRKKKNQEFCVIWNEKITFIFMSLFYYFLAHFCKINNWECIHFVCIMQTHDKSFLLNFALQSIFKNRELE